ncbi:flagellar protein FlaG [Niallia sp. MER 6]|uniref:flagellar protein FlaG n=1 Tax=Niallia sp. MER 6 TaxID=2939567 RepID=UPI002040D0AD|nr:flagellar protein FlaG [Niallia sp. MER 6]MCM3029677.1 flagellar protein FlaG [Niallia sp. MER 6]
MIEKIFSQPINNVSNVNEKVEGSELLKGNSNKENSMEVQISKEEIAKTVQAMNEFLNPSHTSVKFELHEKLNEYYVTIVDDSTQEVVREIPSKKFLDMYAAMTEFVGLMVDKKA